MARSGERAAAQSGLLEAATPAFYPATRVRNAGFFLAFPALEVSGLLACATAAYSELPNGFYVLGTILTDAVLRAWLGKRRPRVLPVSTLKSSVGCWDWIEPRK